MAKRRLLHPSDHELEAEGLPSASGFDAEFRCLGRRALAKRLPAEEDSAVAARGTRIHEALKESDLEQLATSDATTASRVMYGEAKLVNEYDFEGADVTFEERIWDVDDELNHTWSARVDTHHVKGKRLLVGDYKTGWGLPPPIAINWQLRAEAALLAERYDADEAVCALIHPHHPDSLYEVAVYSKEQLAHFLATVRHNVIAIQQGGMPRTPNGLSCQYCPAKRVCPEHKAYMDVIAQNIADEIEDEGFTAIINRSPKERGEAVRQLKDMAKNIEALMKQYVELAVKDSAGVAGFTLRRKMLRSLTNEGKAMELVRAEFGAATLADGMHLSLPDLEKAIAKKLGTGAKDAKTALHRALTSVLLFKEGSYYLEESRSL